MTDIDAIDPRVYDTSPDWHKGFPRKGSDVCICPRCLKIFNSTYAFDMHRVGEFDLTPPHYGRRCLTGQEMLDQGMVKNSKDYWVSESGEGWATASGFLPDPVGEEGV